MNSCPDSPQRALRHGTWRTFRCRKCPSSRSPCTAWRQAASTWVFFWGVEGEARGLSGTCGVLQRAVSLQTTLDVGKRRLGLVDSVPISRSGRHSQGTLKKEFGALGLVLLQPSWKRSVKNSAQGVAEIGGVLGFKLGPFQVSAQVARPYWMGLSWPSRLIASL